MMQYINQLHLSRNLAVMYCLFLLACGAKQTTPAPITPPVVDCIVTDKAALESISIFPADNALNKDISALPADSHSSAIISLIGAAPLKADFGSGLYNSSPIGIPYILVCKNQTKIPVDFRANSYDGNYAAESDAGPYPIPLSAPIEGNGNGGDSHVLAVDVDSKLLYEMYNASVGTGRWQCSGGSIWNLASNAGRPPGWTSADAAGLPILPLLVRYSQVAKGSINHAIRFTLSKAKVMRGYTAPASHLVTGSNTSPAAPTPMGMRLRLKAGVDISGYSATNQVILTAFKKYGLILADIGSDMFISGAPDEHWDNDDLHQLQNIKATDFEVVQMGAIVQ